MSAKELALAAKNRGNEAFTKGDYAKAAEAFTEAISHDPTDAVFYSNRSGAFASLKQFDKALEDANKCVELKPDFVKGYSRQGVALFGLNKLNEAKEVYEKGLKLDPNNAALKEGLTDVDAKLKARSNPLGDLFNPATMFPKLNADPRTREWMKDPSFVQKITMLQNNPNALGALGMGQDPRLQTALGVILGIDFTAMGGGPRGGAAAGGAGGDAGGAAGSGGPRFSNGGVSVDDEDMEDSDDEHAAGGAKVKEETKKQPEPAKPAEPERELTEEEKKELAEKKAEAEKKAAEDAAKAKIRAEADKEKEAGNALYRKRDFPGAIQRYEAAIKIEPTNIVYYNNLATVYMEQKDYNKAIEIAKQGAVVGKEQMANFQDVAKAYARIGSAYHALGDLANAAEWLEKSLIEDFQDKTKQLLKKVQEEKKKLDQQAYIDPAKSEEHKTKGNELYNAGKYADAIAEYSEAIKRDPSNYKVYSNRAACYTKLMDWQRGLDDCEKCLAVDPKFVKAYIRKGKIQHFLKQYHKALATFDQASEIEPNNQEVMEAKRATLIAIQSSEGDPERAKQALADPEIQSILRDPTISKVLQDLQNDPQSGQAAMRDPDIRKKINKLIAAGVLGVK